MNNLDKKQAILCAANEIFCTTGFAKSTVQEIADKAGVGKGTIYEYFNNKEDLFVQMIQSEVSYVFDNQKRIFQVANTLEELIDGYIESSMMLIKNDANKVQLLFDDLTKVSTDLNDWFVKKKKEVIHQLTLSIEQFIERKELREIDAQVVAWMVLDIIRLGFFYKIFYRKKNVKSLLNVQKEVILQGCLRAD